MGIFFFLSQSNEFLLCDNIWCTWKMMFNATCTYQRTSHLIYVAIFFNCLTYPEKKKNNNYNCIHLLILDISFNKSCVFIYTCIYICICTLNTSRCCGHCFTVFFFPFFFLGVNLVKLLDIWYILGFEGKISGGYCYIFTVAHFF